MFSVDAIAKKYGVQVVENGNSAQIVLPSGARITLSLPTRPRDVDEVLEFLGRRNSHETYD